MVETLNSSRKVYLSYLVNKNLRCRDVKSLSAIVRSANAAIDFAENLGTRGEINLPPDVRKGAHKLGLAVQPAYK